VPGNRIDVPGTFELALEASPSGVLVIDPGGTILLVNREIERQFGYTRDELVGQTVELLLPEALRAAHTAHRKDFARSPAPRPMGAGREFLGRRKDGTEIPIEIGLNTIQTGDGLFVVASIADISERRRLEQAHRLAIEEQLAFERLVAELSSQFINLPAAEIDRGIREALARISTALGVDRSTFHSIGRDGELHDPISWTAPGVQPLNVREAAKELFPWTIERVLAGDVVAFSTPDEIPSDIDRRSYQTFDTRSAVVVPLSVEGRVGGDVEFQNVHLDRTWPPKVMHRLRVIASLFGQVLARQRRDGAVRRALTEVERLKDELQAENTSLREARQWTGSTHIVGQSAALQRVLEQIQQVAATDSTVLLLGETGTGKELFATQIHELGPRRGRPMVRVNCAAIPATLIESELFGREKGAYTGALSRQVGRFELADQSTIFLDEIGDLPPEVQVKLLRVLEERQIERLGSPRPITVDTRIIAATHQDLERRIGEGAFREDLFYRLNVFPIRVPPLRERTEDIPQIVRRFVDEFSTAFGKRIESISKESLAALQQYSWPGNVRELRNVVERAMIVAAGPRLTISVPHSSNVAVRRSTKLVDVEKEHIRGVLDGTGWRIRGPGGAADRLGLKPTTLETRMARLGLKRPGHA
jgi:formate hydrogenlyase transcriptional activator